MAAPSLDDLEKLLSFIQSQEEFILYFEQVRSTYRDAPDSEIIETLRMLEPEYENAKKRARVAMELLDKLFKEYQKSLH